MTGNVVLLGFASAIAIAGFLAGAVAGGRLAHALADVKPGRWLATAFTAEAVILAVVTVLGGVGVLPFTGKVS